MSTKPQPIPETPPAVTLQWRTTDPLVDGTTQWVREVDADRVRYEALAMQRAAFVRMLHQHAQKGDKEAHLKFGPGLQWAAQLIEMRAEESEP